jgi:starch synthase
MRRLKVLFVTPEVEPFVKVGGLADMVGALPKEIAALGHDARVMCPLYASTKRVGEWQTREAPLGVDVGPEARWARTWETTLPGTAVPAYFIELTASRTTIRFASRSSAVPRWRCASSSVGSPT